MDKRKIALANTLFQPNRGVVLTFPTNDDSSNSTVSNQVEILLHISRPQDILADLGKPSRVFYKEEDKMKIHSVTDDGAMLGGATDEDAESAERIVRTSGPDEDEKGTFEGGSPFSGLGLINNM